MTIDIDGLAGLDLPSLRAVWAEHVPRRAPPRNRALMTRELARILQEREHSGLDAETKRRLDAAVRAAITSTPRRPDDAEHTKRRRKPEPAPTPYLTPGCKLVREWRGRTYEVTALAPDRFEYMGTEYPSLSEIARLITGTRWSGPRFFGLVRRSKT